MEVIAKKKAIKVQKRQQQQWSPGLALIPSWQVNKGVRWCKREIWGSRLHYTKPFWFGNSFKGLLMEQNKTESAEVTLDFARRQVKPKEKAHAQLKDWT